MFSLTRSLFDATHISQPVRGARCLLLAGALLTSACSAETTAPAPATTHAAASPVQRGQLRAWPETTTYLNVDLLDPNVAAVELGPGRPEGLSAFWSIASTYGAGSAFFYSDLFRQARETRVAHAATVRRVQDIRDAAAFDYSLTSVGPVPAGGVVLVHHLPTARYLAIVVDAIEPVADPRLAGAGPFAFANVTWYLTAAGSADFSMAQ